MSNMSMKKDSPRAKHQFLFSTEDLDFDPKRVEVVDTVTGKKLKVEFTTKIVGNEMTKIFAVRMTPDDFKRIRKTAETAHINPSDFAREAIAKAIQEKEEDSKRIRKNKK